MYGRSDVENSSRLDVFRKRDITLSTAITLYSCEKRSSPFLLLDLVVLLIMGLCLVYINALQPSAVTSHTLFPTSSWFERGKTPERHSGEHPGVGTSTKRQLIKEARPYLAIITDAAAVNNVGKGLILAVIKVESGFNPGAVSSEGAVGLMQLMPLTARDLGVRDPFDPEENIRAGVAYLSYCLLKFNDVKLALAAYNAGPGIVSRLKRVPPYTETQNFVKKVLRHQADYNVIERSGFRT